ncbi:MAG: hypothetical protein ACI37V_04970 [Methanobrevibacter sp.]
MSTPEILQELDMSTNNRDWKYCCKRLKTEHRLDNKQRMFKVRKGEWR